MKTKMKAEEMYASMAPWRLFFVVALPGMVSMFAMSVYSIVEGIFIGQILGEGAFAAVNIAMPLVMINFSLADLIGVGASVPISIALGKKDHATANNVFSCSVILIFLASILMGSIMFFAAEPRTEMTDAAGKAGSWLKELDVPETEWPPFEACVCISAKQADGSEGFLFWHPDTRTLYVIESFI